MIQVFEPIVKSKEKVPCPVIPNCSGFGDKIPLPLYKLQPHIAFKHLENEIRDCAYRLGITDRPRTRDNKLTLATRITITIAQEVGVLE